MRTWAPRPAPDIPDLTHQGGSTTLPLGREKFCLLTKMKKPLPLRKHLCFRKATQTTPLVFPPGIQRGAEDRLIALGADNPHNSLVRARPDGSWPRRGGFWRPRRALNPGLPPTGPFSPWSSHPCLFLIVEGGSGLLFQPCGQLVQ